MASRTDIGTTTTPADMGRADWNLLLGVIVTLLVEDSLGHFSHYTGHLSTIREGVGEAVLETGTRTRLDGCGAGEVHAFARRLIPLVKVHRITWLDF